VNACKGLLDELLREHWGRRLFLARNRARYRHVDLCRFCIREGFAQRYNDVSKLTSYSEIAAAVSDGLRPSDLPDSDLSSIRAEAYAHLGNALRVANRFPEARVALDRALAELSADSPPLIVARVLEFEASYFDSLRHLRKARELLSRAISIYRPTGANRLGPALIKFAIVEGYLGSPARAVRLLREAGPLIRDRDLAVSFLSSLAVNLLECGYPLESEATLYELRKLAPADPLIKLRILWTEARINAHTGSFLVAEQAFREIREAFEARKMFYESALAGLDHALALALAGSLGAARHLLLEVRSLLGIMGVEREALAAKLLDQALLAGCEQAAVRKTLRALHCLPRRSPP
jgi:tetratricopeptide (TPR) repeat protein